MCNRFAGIETAMEGSENAVVCFTNQAIVESFVQEISDEIPVGRELPAILLDGDSLLERDDAFRGRRVVG